MKELSLHILDLAQNSIEAGATRMEINVTEDSIKDSLVIEVKDNGRGMPHEILDRVLDPFVTTRTTRRVGLGLPLLSAAAERCEGDITVQSAKGYGTLVRAAFRLSHIDRAPLGDIPATLVVLLGGNSGLDLVYRHEVDGRRFLLDTGALRERLDPVPISDPMVIEWLKSYIDEGIKSLYEFSRTPVASMRDAETISLVRG